MIEVGVSRAPSALLRQAGRAESTLALLALGIVAAVGVTWSSAIGSDYVFDAGPALNAFAHGDVWGALTVRPQPLMGPVAILARVPFVVVANVLGAGSFTGYRVGAVACLAAGGLFAVYLSRAFPRSSQRRGVDALVVLLAVASPACVAAVQFGHPEEALCAYLSLAAVIAATRGRCLGAAVLLGLAVSTKQWAILAVPPTMLAAGPSRRWSVAVVAAGIAAALTLPLALANLHGLASVSQQAATAPTDVRFDSWWYLVGTDLPGWLAQLTHPAIVLSAFAATLVAARCRIRADGAIPLLALLFLVRCVFDPVNNYYYHLPLVLALLAWDVQSRRRLPYSSFAAAAALVVTNSYLASDAAGLETSLFYFGWTAGLAATLVISLSRLGPKGYGPSDDDFAPAL